MSTGHQVGSLENSANVSRENRGHIESRVSSHPDYDQHEEVVFCDTRDLNAIIAIHNSNLGPAVGGCRIFPYASQRQALADVLRLSRGMTFKSAMAEIEFGGGKSVIIADPSRDKSENMMLAMGEFIDSLGGRYIAAEDSGTSVADIQVMARRTNHVSGFVADEQHLGDPSPRTALGVFLGIQQAVNHRLGTSLSGVSVGVQGAGNVGFHLASLLNQAGAKVILADMNQRKVDRARSELGLNSCSPEEILQADVDVLAPCALGGIINRETIDGIRAGIIAGAANNQLATEDMGEALLDRGILYAPDYVINAGGIIDIYYQQIAVRDGHKIESHLEIIPHNLAKIFAESVVQNRATNRIADEMARQKFFRPQLQSVPG